MLIRETENRPCTVGVLRRDSSLGDFAVAFESLPEDLGVDGFEGGGGVLEFLGDGVLAFGLGDFLAGERVFRVLADDGLFRLLAGEGVFGVLADVGLLAGEAARLGEAFLAGLSVISSSNW